MKISTSKRGLPVATFEISTPKGTKRWRYEYHDGPKCVSNHQKTSAPPWVQAVAQHWGQCISIIRMRYRLWLDEVQRTRPLLEAYHRLAATALMFDQPGARQHVKTLAQALNRTAHDEHGPDALRELYLEYAAKLSVSLHRYEPAKKATSEGPTPETLAKSMNGSSASPMILDLRGHELDAAREVEAVFRAITAKLDAKVGSLEGGGGHHQYVPPMEALQGKLEDAYCTRYRPWAMELMLRRAIPQFQPSRFDVVRDILVDGLGADQADRRFRMPAGRAAVILSEGLRAYPGRRR